MKLVFEEREYEGNFLDKQNQLFDQKKNELQNRILANKNHTTVKVRFELAQSQYMFTVEKYSSNDDAID